MTKEKQIKSLLKELKVSLCKEVAHLFQADKIDFETFQCLNKEIKEGTEYVELEVKVLMIGK